MKRKSTSQSAFFNLRVLIAAVFCLVGVFVAPTPTLAQCSWSAGASLPSIGTRLVGVYFPTNGRFYAMGGRTSDVQGSEFTHPFEYDPVGNSWTTDLAVTYPDTITNNMACGVLTESGIPYIYCAGGSQVASQMTTSRVFRYNPITDVIGTVPAPFPPGAANTLPGGFSVFNNKLYTLGGFNVNVAATREIYEFTPGPAARVLKNAQ